MKSSCVGVEDASTLKKEVPEEVSSQRTLEMSLEDDSLREDDPIERERKKVLQELEIVVQQKSSQQVIMEKIRLEIGELEASVPPNSIYQSMIDHETHFWFWVKYCMISKKLNFPHQSTLVLRSLSLPTRVNLPRVLRRRRNSKARNLIENHSFIDKMLTATLCNEEL